MYNMSMMKKEASIYVYGHYRIGSASRVARQTCIMYVTNVEIYFFFLQEE